jgi:hypothetical protein
LTVQLITSHLVKQVPFLELVPMQGSFGNLCTYYNYIPKFQSSAIELFLCTATSCVLIKWKNMKCVGDVFLQFSNLNLKIIDKSTACQWYTYCILKWHQSHMGTLVQSEDFSPFVLSSTRKLDFNLMEQDKTMQVCMLVPAKKKCL